MNDELTMSNVIDVIVTRHMTMLRRYFEPELLFRSAANVVCPRIYRGRVPFGDYEVVKLPHLEAVGDPLEPLISS